jgi:predicted Zn-dependent protease
MAFDRRQEQEADHIGVFLMTFAGYQPEETVRFWMNMRRATQSGPGIPEFLSDHPSDERRIQNMKEWVPRALAGKRAFDEGPIAPSAQ